MRIFTALAAGALCLGLSQAMAQSTSPGAELLPDGDGRDTVIRVCTGCHAAEVIVNRTQKDMAWPDVVQAMVDKGAVATPAEVEQIAAYLEKALPETAAGASAVAATHGAEGAKP
ncbi:MAG: PQQ-binding-like beta-propeller repeat protein [Phenylobacterium sp.]|nr:PQQ-binding-like beta-propeller repeat protein [Phenylobacterium sp.]